MVTVASRLFHGVVIRGDEILPAKRNDYQHLFYRPDTDMAVSIILILGWLAGSDGRVSGEEWSSLRNIASGIELGPERTVDQLVKDSCRGDAALLEPACLFLSQVDEERRLLIMDLAIGVAIADGFLAIPENHILRFLGDLLCVNVADAFESATNLPFPEPGDPSQIEWWESRETSAGTSDDSDEDDDLTNTSRRCAFATLGLSGNSTAAQIEEAYRRLANIHHPDRFTHIGRQAELAASRTFSRIKAAYELLT